MTELTRLEKFEHFKAAPALPPVPSHWRLHLWPGTTGALVRFGVSFDGECRDLGEGLVSIYFDVLSKLGCVAQPYWELYPNAEGDNERFLCGEEAELFEAIEKSLQDQKASS